MGDAPKPKRKLTWLWIILGILFMLFVAGVAAVFIGFSYLRQNVSVARDISDADANREFDAVLAKFPGQQPLIRLVDGRHQLVVDRANPSPDKRLTTLHLIAFDEDDGEMARISLPFWLLRMKSGPIDLTDDFRGWSDRGASFTIEDLEKAGPGIVMDVTQPRDGRVLVWVE
jgi:hypothetical protein